MTLATTLAGQPGYLAQQFDVHLFAGEGDTQFVARAERQEGMTITRAPLTRRISPVTDARALASLAADFRRIRPDIVQTYTPKAGLVGMAAARLAGVPLRVHGVVGMPLMEAHGKRALALHASERATIAGATHLTCNSRGLREWMWKNLTSRPITVVGDGSINGVDTERFAPPTLAERAEARRAVGVGDGEVLFAFVGRIVRDKGVEELLEAARRVAAEHAEVRFVLIGDEEAELDPISREARDVLSSGGVAWKTGFVDDVRPVLRAADAFVLPSYREGLPNSLIEAAAMGLPSVATDINGCNEVIREGVTGLLVPPKDAPALEAALRVLLKDATARKRMGAAARADAVARFDQRTVLWPALSEYYEHLLDSPLP